MRPPPEVIDAVGQQLGPLRAGPEPLGGGITNHNWRARFGEADVVLRIAGRQTDLLGIDRETEHVATEAAAALGIAPEVLAYLPEHECLVTRFVEGHPVGDDELRDPSCLEAVARALRAFHDRAPALPTPFAVDRLAHEYLEVAESHGAALPAGAREAAALADRIAAALHGPEHAPAPCHDDLLRANFIRADERVWIVDWEYAGMGDRYFDLGNLSVNNGFSPEDDERLLRAYWGEPASAARFGALRVMRAMSDVREALWGVVQDAISELDFDYAGYAGEHLTRLRASAADPDFERWLADAASP